MQLYWEVGPNRRCLGHGFRVLWNGLTNAFLSWVNCLSCGTGLVTARVDFYKAKPLSCSLSSAMWALALLFLPWARGLSRCICLILDFLAPVLLVFINHSVSGVWQRNRKLNRYQQVIIILNDTLFCLRFSHMQSIIFLFLLVFPLLAYIFEVVSSIPLSLCQEVILGYRIVCIYLNEKQCHLYQNSYFIVESWNPCSLLLENCWNGSQWWNSIRSHQSNIHVRNLASISPLWT
jgi:hypothetical protein